MDSTPGQAKSARFIHALLLVSLFSSIPFGAGVGSNVTNEFAALNHPLIVSGKMRESGGPQQEDSACLPPGIQVVAKLAPDPTNTLITVNTTGLADCNDPQHLFIVGQTYTANTNAFNDAAIIRQWVFGALTVPFKYYKWGDGTIGGSASVGPYFGYRNHFNSVDLTVTWAVFGGATTVTVPKVTNTGTVNSTANGFSYGLGMFIAVGSGAQAQIGFVIGRDHVSQSADWVNNSHGWLAFEAGYAFY